MRRHCEIWIPLLGLIGVLQAVSALAAGPWAALERLGRYDLPAAPGARVEAVWTAWESAPEEVDAGLRVLGQPGRGPGAWLEGERWGGPDVPPWVRVGGGVLFRTARWRLLLGAAQESMAGNGLLEAVGGGDVQVGDGLLLSSRLLAYPGEREAPLLVSAGLYAGRGSWLGGLEVGPGPRELRLGVGVLLGGGLVWTASYAEPFAEVGIAWGAGPAELRVAAAEHPDLGTRSRARLLVGARGR